MNTTSTTVSVSGMTCGHCVSSVTEELETLDGVEEVAVDLNPRGLTTVTVTSTRDIPHSEISEAIAEAGYLMVDNHA